MRYVHVIAVSDANSSVRCAFFPSRIDLFRNSKLIHTVTVLKICEKSFSAIEFSALFTNVEITSCALFRAVNI